jgi:hypothetical protein
MPAFFDLFFNAFFELWSKSKRKCANKHGPTSSVAKPSVSRTRVMCFFLGASVSHLLLHVSNVCAPLMGNTPPESVSTKSVNEERGPEGWSYAVFFNTCVPRENEKLENVLIAAKEQTHQIGASTSKPFTLHCNTIGLNDGLNLSAVDSICSRHNNMKCSHMEHFDHGFEEVTLNKLQDCCSESDHISHRVACVHNKGSHHPRLWFDKTLGKELRQDSWCRHGTAAATSELCILPQNTTCNVCGILWTPVPWQHVSPSTHH